MPNPLRIAIDGRTLTGRFTGDRTYWRNLIRALLKLDTETEYHIYTRLPLPEGELPTAPNLFLHHLPAKSDRLWLFWTFPMALRKAPPNVVHVQYTVPFRILCPYPLVTTIHDISFRLHPEWFERKDRFLMNLTVPPSMRRAERVLTVSETSRQQILETYPLPPEKVIATPLGVSEEFFLSEAEAKLSPTDLRSAAKAEVTVKFGITTPFVLAVGVLQPRKNLPLLAEAFGRAKIKYNLPHKLVLTGKIGWGAQSEALQAAWKRSGASEEALVLTGYVEDADVPLLMRACDVFAHPALFEGFGLPVVEAMTCGAPVVVSEAPPMPEIAGSAALRFEGGSVEAWTEGLATVLLSEEIREELSAKGREHTKQFTWERMASGVLDAYRSALMDSNTLP